ncbi:MFS transporter [Actinacidiphila glaucinigra]|uniref:MFS transporter n=1 Tax=Actinacidiphila glaucinigra TaxID=235986 RepID=UPI00386D2E96
MTNPASTPDAAASAPVVPARHRWAALAVCCLAAMLLGIDNSVLNYAIPSLLRDMGPSGTEILWISDVYGFAMGGLLVVMGNLGDRFGRKRMMLLGAAAFGVASLITAYAPTPGTLIAGRALLGVAGAAMVPSTLSVVRHAFTDPRERTTAIGISSGVGAASFALGPVVGGLLLDHFWWGSVFLINVPLMAVVLVAGVLVLPESRNPRPGRLDWIGVPLSVVGVVGAVYAIKEGFRDGADHAPVWIAAAVGAAALTLFARRQVRVEEPLIAMRLFRNPAFSGAVGSNLVMIFASSTLSLAFSLYFQVVRGWSPLTAGLALLPGPLAAAFAAPLATALIPRLGRARVVALGLVLLSASTAALGSLSWPGTPYWGLLAPLVVNGAGIILIVSVTNDTILASAPKARTGAAAAVSETAMEMGGSLGIAVLGSLLGAVYRDALVLPPGLPAGTADSARESVGGAAEAAVRVPGADGIALLTAAKDAFCHSVQVTAVVGAVLLAVGAVAALYTLRGVPAEIPDPEAEEEVLPPAVPSGR